MTDLIPDSRYPLNISVPPPSHTRQPGNGFYKYINQEWLKTTHIPNSYSEYGASEEIEKKNKVQILQILKKLDKKEPTRIPTTSEDHIRFFSYVWAKSHYSNEEVYVKSVINQILDCRTPQDMARMFGWLCSVQLSAFIDINRDAEEKEPFFVRNIISDAPLILPRKYYLKKSLKSSPVWIAYMKLVYTCATELSLPHLFTAIQAETELANIYRMHSNEDLETEYKGSALDSKFPDFLWSEFMEGLGSSHWRQQIWVIQDPVRVKRILKWICTADMEKIASIFTLYFVNMSSAFLRPSIKEASFNLFQGAIKGIKQPQSSEDIFLNYLGTTLPDALCMEFSKVEGSKKKKKDLEDLIYKIKDSAVIVMRNNHSLAKHTTDLTIEKIHRMKVSVGSTKMDSLPKAEYFPDSLTHTIVSIRIARFEQESKKVNKPVNHDLISYPCHIVNASYYEDLNHIVIPWGILQCPFYCENAPLGWNYGGVGATIAHEITHAFDLEGSHYNERAKYREWWTRKDRQHFKSRTRKIGKFFSKFKHYGVHLDGDYTLSENWADFGGLIISLHALKKELDLLNYSLEKRKQAIKTFFVSYAVSWRDFIRKKKALHSIDQSVHSLAEDRVDRIVPHFQEWVDVFNIKETDKLYLPVKDRLKFF